MTYVYTFLNKINFIVELISKTEILMNTHPPSIPIFPPLHQSRYKNFIDLIILKSIVRKCESTTHKSKI